MVPFATWRRSHAQSVELLGEKGMLGAVEPELLA